MAVALERTVGIAIDQAVRREALEILIGPVIRGNVGKRSRERDRACAGGGDRHRKRDDAREASGAVH
jgi:hypothetical protein